MLANVLVNVLLGVDFIGSAPQSVCVSSEINYREVVTRCDDQPRRYDGNTNFKDGRKDYSHIRYFKVSISIKFILHIFVSRELKL